MTGFRWFMVLAAPMLVACAHAKDVEPTEQAGEGAGKKTQAREPAPNARPPTDTVAPAPNARPPTDTLPMAASPAGLLEPGAEEKIQEALKAKGFKSLQAFQRAQDLPETGEPDHETVRRLGLDPDKIFKRGSTP